MFGGKPGAWIDDEKLNSKGYRGKEAIAPKPEDEYRIIMLGGSSVFVGKPTISDLLEEKFKNNGYKNVKCYNYGVVSSVSKQELVRLTLEVSELEADLVIMYNGANDIFSPVSLDPRPGYPFNFIVYEKNPLLHRKRKAYPALDLFLYGSNVARIVAPNYFEKRFVNLAQLQKEAGYMTEEWMNEISKQYVSSIIKADKIAKAFGSELVVFFQPNLFYKDLIHDDELGNLNRKTVVQWAEYAHDLRARILEEVKKAQQVQNISFANLSDIFRKDKNKTFNDFIHIKQEYRPEVANAIYKNLMENIDIK